jgi:hypothetical protein
MQSEGTIKRVDLVHAISLPSMGAKTSIQAMGGLTLELVRRGVLLRSGPVTRVIPETNISCWEPGTDPEVTLELGKNRVTVTYEASETPPPADLTPPDPTEEAKKAARHGGADPDDRPRRR